MPVESPVKTEQGMVSFGQLDELGKFVLQRYTKAKAFRKQVDGPWDRWYRRYSGQHWDRPRPAWKSSPTVNFVFSTIETILPIMTDNRPTITIVPTEPNDTGIADILGNITQKIWISNDMDLKLPMMLKNTLKYGTGFAKVWWNPQLDNGLGDVAISVVDPRHMFPSPGAVDLEDAEYIAFAANLPIANIERMYPDAKGKIRPGIWDEELTIHKDVVSDDSQGMASVGPIATTDGTLSSWPVTGGSHQQLMDRKEIATLVELWYRDDSGKATVVIMANGTLLKGPVAPFRHNKFPFVRFLDYQVPGMFWGMGDIQQLEPLQLSINERRGQTTDILKLTANPAIIADADSGINPKALRNKPGLIILKNRGSEVKWMNPPAIPVALFEIQNLDKQDLDAVSGVFDVTQGRRPVGIEAASAIVELQEAAQTRIRAKVRNMEASLRNMGQLVVGLIQEFYTEERVVRIYGTGSTKPQFIVINQQVPGAGGSGIQKINDVTAGKFDVEIGVGSTMPINKTRRFAQMVELFKAGIVDGQAVLEHAGLSPEEVLRIITRMKQEEQQLLAMQGLGGPAGPGGGPPGPEPSGSATQLPSEEELSALEERIAGTQLGEEGN